MTYPLLYVTLFASTWWLLTTTAAEDNTNTTKPETRVWSPGRITQVTLAVVESTLLTLMLVFPQVMDPIVSFINKHVGGSGSRRRRDVRAVVTEQAAAIHNLLLDAIDQFEDMDNTLAMVPQ
ncbi:uncharacterized protein [Procambarus clarkii]|uniref:uncharacterized protein isoform X2 n=1 Tax=Procambarus clarkii TaxID=6728 RepID=UPI001E67046D|nr:uncharacterized protein LOC123758540 isoform X2 [Procambarus clarkii]